MRYCIKVRTLRYFCPLILKVKSSLLKWTCIDIGPTQMSPRIGLNLIYESLRLTTKTRADGQTLVNI